MNMLKIHAAALESELPVIHEFKLRYSKHAKTVYGFVEGKDDPSFYRGFIEQIVPPDWSVELWPAGNKVAVCRILESFDWRRFPKQRICFFVDRDLSEFLDEVTKRVTNLYVTPEYSIENVAANKVVCERILTELLGFSETQHNEMDAVGRMFELQLERFLKSMSETMAWILYWRKQKLPASLSNIEMKHMFSLTDGVVESMDRPKNKSSVKQYIHEQCGLTFTPDNDIEVERLVFATPDNYRKFTRGKYVLWFLVEFCKSVHRGATKVFTGVSKPPKVRIELSAANAFALVAPRCRMPPCLSSFLRSNYGAYVERVGSKVK